MLPNHPLGSVASGTAQFWSNNTTLAPTDLGGAGCSRFSYSFLTYYYWFNDCYGGAVDPTVVNLPNGDVGVGYSIATGQSVGFCPGEAGNVSYLVGFSVSADGGQTFGAPSLMGNQTCTYYNAIEPSFTVAPNGAVYGVYVEENYSGQQGMYTSRADDALGFTLSTNNGANFTPPISIVSTGNIARPQIAAFGSSLYVLYENISASTTTYLDYGQGACCAYPISLNVLYSPNDGATWKGPYKLPGQNPSAGNTEMGGWLQVNASGTVGVSYFTNHSCAMMMYSYCYHWGDDLVFATSTSNGSSWSSPTLVTPAVGESGYYMYYYLPAYFQEVPQSQFVFDSSGNSVYIAYSGTYNQSAPSSYWYSNYGYSGVFEATGTVSGSSWALASIAWTPDYFSYDNEFNPSISFVGGTLYLAFSWENTTYCYGSCTAVENTWSEWAATSSDGVSWSDSGLVDAITMQAGGYYCGYYCGDAFLGFHSSIASTANGTPVLGFALPLAYTFNYQYNTNGTVYNYWYNSSYPDQLEVAFPYTGPTVTVNFTEQNLAVGTNWSFWINGYTFHTTSASFFITDIPVSTTVSIVANSVPAGFWTIITPNSSIPDQSQFTQNSTVWFNYTYSFGISISVQPPTINYADVTISFGGNYYYMFLSNCVGCTPYFYAYPAFPWYFPANSVVQVTTYGYPVNAAYWTGTGPGSYTGSGQWANLTIGGIINETVWFGGFGVFDEEVNPIGLPATSIYQFQFNGTTYSAGGQSRLTIANVSTGAYSVTNIQANSTTAGWEYFGSATPANPVIIPVEPVINLSFAYVDVGAPVGTVSLEAQGLTSGTVWTFSFNGTVYSSSTPWINITTRPGTFPVQGFPVTAENASVGYVPSGLGSTLSVTTGSTYTISFAQAFKVQVIAGTGGTLTGGGISWVASGSTLSAHATAKANYEFGGWTGSGLGSYTGTDSYANFTVLGPVIETASFYPLPTARFNLTLAETGLANGTWWTVYVGGIGYSSDQPIFEVPNLHPCGDPSGTYTVSVPYAHSGDGLTRFAPTSQVPSTICTSGATTLTVSFASQYWLGLQSTPGGYGEASAGAVTTTTGLWAPSGVSVTLSAIASTGYEFVGWSGSGPGSYTGSSTSVFINVAGPVTETAVFQEIPIPPPLMYTIDFHSAAPLAAGTAWEVSLGGQNYSSTTTDILVPQLLGGTYALDVATSLSPDGLTQYTPVGAPPSLTVNRNQTVSVDFRISFWVSVQSAVGGQAVPGSGWVVNGGNILLNATAASGYAFVGWNGSGLSAYTGSNQTVTLRVTSPITEVALFAPVPAAGGTSGQGSSFWLAPSTWVAFAVVGLVAGLVVGLIAARRRRTPPVEPAEVEPPAPTEEPVPEAP